MSDEQLDDPTGVPLEKWLEHKGTRTGTFTYNGVTYTDMNEIEWRQANNAWEHAGATPMHVAVAAMKALRGRA